MRILKDVLKKNINAIIVLIAGAAAFTVISLLYDIITEPAVYASCICLFCLAALLGIDFAKEKRKAERLGSVLMSPETEWSSLPAPESAAEEDYARIVAALGEACEKITDRAAREQQDCIDYYTAWVHQIKTPISVMKMKLTDDTEQSRALSSELFRIEQYVNMALQYIRLGSGTNDLVIDEYPLDDMIKETLRKFAPSFIEKKLALNYRETAAVAVTDKKWFCCIIEQFISNAIKYTPSGTVEIFTDGNTLYVRDCGIGIDSADLPRIFEKGYTGMNGRLGNKSSGLGLYLAKKAADMLNLRLGAESEAGKGSCFSVGFNSPSGSAFPFMS